MKGQVEMVATSYLIKELLRKIQPQHYIPSLMHLVRKGGSFHYMIV